jgi:GNAT superfamily N-acetyltransferase
MSKIPAVARLARTSDIDPITQTLTSAFFDDPLWGPVFHDESKRAQKAGAMWRVFVTSALRYPWTWTTDHSESVTLWIPPGGSDLTPAEEADFEPFIIDVAGRRAGQEILRIFDILYAAHPTRPHYYLSLFGTHSDHRGQGLGMRVLAENLERIDATGMPAYLESTNPANLKRYASVGFDERDELAMPSGHVVTTMWRPAVS